MHAKQKGFTLIELLVVIAITAIMAVIALPNMSQWIASRRAASSAEQVANLLRFARSEAVRLNLPVYICPVQIKKDGKSNGDCNQSFQNQGIAAFADNDKNHSYTRNTDLALRTVILNGRGSERVHSSFSHYDFNGTKSAASPVFWVFMPNGSFGYTADASLNNNALFIFSSGYTKIAITDAAASTQADKIARASVVLVDSSGLAQVCTKSDSRNLCQYSE